MTIDGYTCKRCDKYHTGLPMSYGADAPAYWYGIPEAERRRRATLGPEQCIIDDHYFFVIGNVEIPVSDGPGPFVWSAWVSLSEKSFKRMSELWEVEGRESEPPYFGWFSTSLPGYPNTLRACAKITW